MTEVSMDIEVRRLPSLTTLRAPAALLIFFTHTSDFGGSAAIPGYRVLDLGYVGVSLFFCISGFVLAWGVRSVGESASRRRFYGRRVARIVPLHLLTTLLACLVISQAGVGHVLAAVFLLQTWWPLWHSAGNPVSWSLCCEAFFYAILPPLITLARRRPAEYAWRAACLWFGLTSIVLVTGSLADGGMADDYLHWQPVTNLAPFLLGAAAGFRMRTGWRPTWAVWPVAFGLLAFSTVVVVALRVYEAGRPSSGLVITLLTPAFVVLVVTGACADLGPARRRPLSHPVLIFCGEASFAFYLIHLTVLEALLNIRGQASTAPQLVLLVVATFTISCVLAVVLHKYVELPCQSSITRRLDSRASRGATSESRDSRRIESMPPSPR